MRPAVSSHTLWGGKPVHRSITNTLQTMGLIFAAALACSACSKAPSLSEPSHLSGPKPITFIDGQSSPPSPQSYADNDSDIILKKTYAGKILTAIALERVTGRKPDPARFSELY